MVCRYVLPFHIRLFVFMWRINLARTNKHTQFLMNFMFFDYFCLLSSRVKTGREKEKTINHLWCKPHNSTGNAGILWWGIVIIWPNQFHYSIKQLKRKCANFLNVRLWLIFDIKAIKVIDMNWIKILLEKSALKI